MRILGIAGSVRRGSHNRRLIRSAGDTLPSGVELVEWDGLAGLPIFDEDLESDPPAVVQDLLDEIKASGAHVLEAELPVGMAYAAFDDDGSLADPELTARLGDLLGDLCREIRA